MGVIAVASGSVGRIDVEGASRSVATPNVGLDPRPGILFHSCLIVKGLFRISEHIHREGSPAVSVVERTYRLLEQLASQSGPVGVTDLANELGLPKSSVHRLLSTLEGCGYVTREPRDQGYVVGPALIQLGSIVSLDREVRSVAAPHLRELVETTREVVHLGVYDRGDVVIIEKLDSPQPVAPQSRVGVRAPSACVATGRALLAFQPTREVERVLDSQGSDNTCRTTTERKEFRALLEDVRRDGFAVNRSSWREGVCGVAAPIRDHTGTVVASVGCCVPEMRFGDQQLQELQASVVQVAAAISAGLGHYATGAKVAVAATEYHPSTSVVASSDPATFGVPPSST